MNGRDSIQSLLVLRKLTRAMTEATRVQMTEHLTTLTPLLRPKIVLGRTFKEARRNRTAGRTRHSRSCRRSTRPLPPRSLSACHAS